MAGGNRPGRRHKSPGVVYTSLSVVICLLVAILAITASQTPPPAIAELAPQAEQIKEAPPEQASELGSAEGGSGGGGGVPTTTPTTLPPGPGVTVAPIRPPRQRRCVGTPPRQTEDPQAPPCVIWQGGDNGGPTSKGVTDDEIRVAVATSDGKINRHWQAIELHFNARYELYGRKLRLIPYVSAGNNVPCSAMKADAVKVDEEVDAFASANYGVQRGNEACHYDELARRGIISIQTQNNPPAGGEAHLEKFAPYQWNYLPSVDKILRSLGEVLCKNLVGKPPRYASGTQRTALTRTFGLVTEVALAGAPSVDTSIFDTAARACNAEIVRVQQSSNVSPAERNTLAREAVLKLKDQGVTSVICLCDASYLVQFIWPASTLETYYPEWITQDYQGQDTEMQMQVGSQNDQRTQIFGIRSWNKAIPRADNPFWMATREGDPTFPAERWLFSFPYWSLLVLASGIQAAGPHLTPQAFQAGLYRTQFANPGCGGPPLFQACVGFGPNNHTMIQDATLVWYDNQGRPRDTDPDVGGATAGRYCYVDNGRRYKAGQFPSGDPAFFQPTCP